ncbi:L-ornithine N(5)-monooxygenase [Didymella pomorum]|uniref:L-ornithine N(5)-monooxygenase [NAD(P)H] n=1 Tax=Didymella pomorum TaxID=749634 RepID=A0A9W8ZFT1_9PLEO|nr:L-ornithine N(5)-monooxygenase [Didymella pomorum]
MSPHAEFPTSSSGASAPQRAFGGFTQLEESDFPAFENRSNLRYTPQDELHDLICVGFGPASLAIGVAIHDALDGTDPSLVDIPGLEGRAPKVAFLEKQERFAWHAGMLLPGAKMQITFMKDMATMRNPRSEFTFINYLHQKNRLVEFANLNTFLPARVEYEDYMKWCASWFEEVVSYSQEVIAVNPQRSSNGDISVFEVVSKNHLTNEIETRRTRHVVIAAGGRPNITAPFPQNHPKVVHSSKFSYISKQILRDHQAPYKVAVVGNGQSAAEIFDFLHANYPNSQTRLLIKGGALRPSDDSPFVNEIFNPARTEVTYNRDPILRAQTLTEDKGTNYGVVRINLLEHIYETLYLQRIRYGNSREAEEHWPHNILPYRRVTAVEDSPVVQNGIRLHVRDQSPLYFSEVPGAGEEKQTLDVDAVFVATGYLRNLHETLLKDARHLMPGGDLTDAKWTVGRDYRVNFEDKAVSDDAGVWLQGCCETTHGLSDTLLSVLACRGGEMARSIFEKAPKWDSSNVLEFQAEPKL